MFHKTLINNDLISLAATNGPMLTPAQPSGTCFFDVDPSFILGITLRCGRPNDQRTKLFWFNFPNTSENEKAIDFC